MAFLMVHQNVDQHDSVWHIDNSAGLAAAQVWPKRDVIIEWEDGTLETIPALTRAELTGSPSVDLTSLDYYLVVGQGAPTTLVLAAITDIGTFDTLIVAQPWGILRVLGKWGSAPYWPSSGGGGSPPTPVYARAHATNSQTFPDGAWTILNFDTVDFDSASAITTGSSWAYTVPSNGIYRVHYSVWMANGDGTPTQGMFLHIRQNGSDVDATPAGWIYGLTSGAGSGAMGAPIAGDDLIACTAGDTLAVAVENQSGFSHISENSDFLGAAKWITINKL